MDTALSGGGTGPGTTSLRVVTPSLRRDISEVAQGGCQLQESLSATPEGHLGPRVTPVSGGDTISESVGGDRPHPADPDGSGHPQPWEWGWRSQATLTSVTTKIQARTSGETSVGAWNSFHTHVGDNLGQLGTFGDNGGVPIPVSDLLPQGMLLQELETGQEMLHEHSHHQGQPEGPGRAGWTPGMSQNRQECPKS